MIDHKALYIPPRSGSDRPYAILHNIAAIELMANNREHGRLGMVTQLPSGTRVEVCGSGFNERTVKVRSNERYYFVFWQDLAALTA